MTSRRQNIGLGLSMMAVLLLAACGSDSRSGNAPQMQSRFDYDEAALETYPLLEVGDSFRFDSPDVVWRVTAANAEKVVMVSESGARQVRPSNPLLPNIEWSNKTHGTGKRLITDMKGSFFPLRVGNEVSFRSTVDTDKPPYAWEYDWNCRVDSQHRITVPAGDFDTFKVDCKRRELEKISLYYAPKVGYSVRFDNSNPQSGAVNSNVLIGYQRGDMVVGQIVPNRPDKKEQEKQAEKAVMPAPMMNETKKDDNAELAMPKLEKTSKAEPAMVKPAASGGMMIHLASYKNASNVERDWKRLQEKFKTELGSLNHEAKAVDIPGKGLFNRLLAGPLPDRAAANALCRQLKAKGQYCAVMTR